MPAQPGNRRSGASAGLSQRPPGSEPDAREGDWEFACDDIRRAYPAADTVGMTLQLWRWDRESTYSQTVRGGLGAVIDRRLARLIILRLRRHWPLLELVPVLWILPIVAPKVRSLRRSLSRAALAVAVPVGVVIALIVRHT